MKKLFLLATICGVFAVQNVHAEEVKLECQKCIDTCIRSSIRKNPSVHSQVSCPSYCASIGCLRK